MKNSMKPLFAIAVASFFTYSGASAFVQPDHSVVSTTPLAKVAELSSEDISKAWIGSPGDMRNQAITAAQQVQQVKTAVTPAAPISPTPSGGSPAPSTESK